MKLISKKTIWFTVITTLCLAAVTLFAVSGCDKSETPSKYYTINFVGEGIDITPQSIEHGMRASKPENPVREGYDFCGWFTDNGTFANEWNFKTDIITQDTTLYAKWDTLQNYPIEIPFTEYSLAQTSCQWKNFESNKVIIINSDEELKNHINCLEGNYPEINFSKHTLLLARGRATNGIRYIDTNFLQETVNNYTLNVNIHTYMTMEAPPWLISIVTPKIGAKATITLHVEQIND